MKRQFLAVALFGVIMVSAQAQKGTRKVFFDQLTSETVILTKDGLVKGGEINDFASGFANSYGNVNSYDKNFSIKVSSVLDYEIGEIQTNSTTFSVMFL